MIGQRTSARGNAYRYYICRHRQASGTCSAPRVPADEAEAGAWRVVQRVLFDGDFLRRTAEELGKRERRDQRDLVRRRAELERQRRTQEQRIARIGDGIAQGGWDRVLGAKLEQERVQLTSIEVELAEIEAALSSPGPDEVVRAWTAL